MLTDSAGGGNRKPGARGNGMEYNEGANGRLNETVKQEYAMLLQILLARIYSGTLG